MFVWKREGGKCKRNQDQPDSESRDKYYLYVYLLESLRALLDTRVKKPSSYSKKLKIYIQNFILNLFPQIVRKYLWLSVYDDKKNQLGNNPSPTQSPSNQANAVSETQTHNTSYPPLSAEVTTPKQSNMTYPKNVGSPHARSYQIYDRSCFPCSWSW